MEEKTLEELNLMTKEELVSLIIGDKKETETICTKSIDSVNGQVAREFVIKDLAGTVIKTEKWDWKYDKSGVVSEITKTVLNEKSMPIESTKIATVDGVLKNIKVDIEPVDIKPVDIKPIEEKPIDIQPAKEVVVK